MILKEPIRNIIFDFGGVILDIDPSQTMNHLKKLGIKDVEIFNTPKFQQEVMNKFERGILTPEVFRDKVRAFIGTNICDQDIDEAWNALLLDIPIERIRVLELAKKNYTIMLLSNSNEIHYEVYVRDLQLRFGYREFDQLFHKAYFSFDLHLSKPNPEIFEFVLNQHKMIPEQTLFIDDTPEHIESARKLGLRTYHLLKPERVRDLFKDGILREDLKID
ncbi:MAG: HAD family phosphatase [Bacteroidetes bacterium HGW-Bacteroidetes-1]|jgi:putative hydrolase of the HAD superfamily|nr:MAG: HAD family phosphatase [Bacteroidetes bacterium HGW-Bacteroidetes-1]